MYLKLWNWIIAPALLLAWLPPVTYPEVFLGILFSVTDFREGVQKDIIVNYEELFSVINMYEWHGPGLLFTYQLY